MGMNDWLRGQLWAFLLPGDMVWKERVDRYNEYLDYYRGKQKRNLRVRPEQADDNLTENYIELVVERSISLMLGDGVKFELPDEGNQEYIDEVMRANRQDITLYDCAQNAAIYGTGFIKIVPAGVESKQRENVMLPRLVVLDPTWMQVNTEPEDVGTVIGYEMRYNVGDLARKEITSVFEKDTEGRVLSWQVDNYKADQTTGGRWTLIPELSFVWEYEFPPILHWKNLPLANSAYGRDEVSQLIELQDRVNFVSSNISKIIRYHAHPKTWGRGAGLGNKASWGADEIVMVNGTAAMLQNLEMQSDLASSREFRDELKAALMEISRTVDLSSMKDKVGALTNFGLRVLYNDALDKCSTKRDIFGDALIELVHRLLVLDNRPGEAGEVVWPDPLPVNETEEVQAYGFDLEQGLVSKQTISTRRGYDWEQEQERIEEDKQANDNIGSMLLRAFDRGTDMTPARPPQVPPQLGQAEEEEPIE